MIKETFRVNPKFCVIIPTYNNVTLFSRALDSVLNQDYDNWNVIVTDDSDTPLIEEYCNSISDTRIHYYSRSLRDGAVANWNNGLSLATSQYVIVMHHDEELVGTDYLTRLSGKLKKADIVVSDIRVCENGLPERKGRINGLVKRWMLAWPVTFFIANPIGPCACVAFKRELMQKFDENLTWIVDTEWYYRMLSSAKGVTYAPDMIIKSNSGHSDQITLNINIRAKDREDTKYLHEKYHDNFAVCFSLTLKKFMHLLQKSIHR